MLELRSGYKLCSSVLLEHPVLDSQKERPLNELHLFAGVGGGILGGLLCGHVPVCAVEIEAYARAVLIQRQRDGILPAFPVWDNVRTFDGTPWRGIANIVCGGFPCQDISTANRQLGEPDGLGGERSGLWAEMRRIVGEVRPRFVFVENSPMLALRGLDRILGDLAALGYDARWGVFSAADVGARHLRERIWIVAHSNEVESARGDGGHIQPNQGGDKITQFRREDWKRDELVSACCGELDGGWKICPDSVGEVDALANWVERAAAIGNGQVPAVAAMAWKILSASARCVGWECF